MASDDIDALAAAIAPVTARVRQDVTARLTPDKGMVWTRQRLTPERIHQHLNGGPARGASPIAAGQSVTLIALIDVDAHGDGVSWPDVADAVDRICTALDQRGLVGIPWRSRGGSGAHIYLLWDDPQDARSVRAALREALAEGGLADGAKGLAHSQAEVFPKQDSVPDGGYGNQFILPLAGASVPLDPLTGYAPMGRAAAVGMPWPVSADVDLVPGPEPLDTTPDDDADLRTLASALDAIPNAGPDELGYDEWRDIIFAIHSVDSGPDGLDLAETFSAKSDKYDPKFLHERVWPYVNDDRERKVTARTVLWRAREHGWTEPAELVAEDFEFSPPATIGSDGQGPGASAQPVEPSMPPLSRKKDGTPLATIDNVTAMMGDGAWYLDCEIRYDTFQGAAMISDYGAGAWRRMTDADIVDIRIRLARLGFDPVSQDMVRHAVSWIADRYQFDSAQLWLDREVPAWDGVGRVDRFFRNYYHAEDHGDPEYVAAVGAYLWTALAGRIYTPGLKTDMVPILTGKQGIRKSGGLQAMVPAPEYHREMSLASKEDDLKRSMRGALICELDELRGMRKREAEHLKSFISIRIDRWTPKYQESEIAYPRRCVFVGTTNDPEFLSDPTGHRRFLPLDIISVDTDAIERDRMQLWAEARDRYKAGGLEYAVAEERAADHHERYETGEAWEDAIAVWLSESALSDDLIGDGAARGDQPFTTLDVLREAIGLPVGQITPAAQQRAASILRRMGYNQHRKRLQKNARSRWWSRD